MSARLLSQVAHPRVLSSFSNSRGPAAATFAIRAFADVPVEVEHGRGHWKTYGDIDNYKPGKYQIKCFNKISEVGLNRFTEDHYDVRRNDDDAPNAHAILLRSHKLKEEEVPLSVRAIARCGAGTNK